MNETLLQYLLESATGLTLLYLFYVLVLRRETAFQFNRFYLLAALVLSLGVPLSNLPGIALWPQKEVPMVVIEPMVDYVPMATAVVMEAPVEAFNYWNLLYIAYGIGVLFFALRFLGQVIHLRRFAKRAGVAFHLPNKAPVILTDGQYPTFSFWRWVFFDNSQALAPEETERILQHEQVHLDQRHTLDVLLVSVAGIIFWFNPLLRLFKKALEQTHEFIADAQVAKVAGSSAYSSLLVKQVFRNADFPLGSYFFLNRSLTLTRIKMMKKLHQSPKLSRLLLVVPLLALFLGAVAAMRPLPTPETTIGSPAVPEEKPALASNAPAVFPGGREALNTYVKSNFVLPEVAFQKRKSQNDFVQVTANLEVEVQEDGTPMYRRALEMDVRPNDEAVRKAVEKQFAALISQMPKWTPAQKDGKAIASKEIISVSSASGNFVNYASYLESRQQKTAVSSKTGEGNTAKGVTSGSSNILAEVVMVYYPSSVKVANTGQEKKASGAVVMPVNKTTNSGEKIYVAAEKMPEYPGGMSALFKFLASKIRIPASAQRSEIEGTMVGTFVVSASGEVIMEDVVQSLSPSLDHELKRVLATLPAFAPGIQNGKPVPVRYYFPLRIVAKRAAETSATNKEITVEGKPSGTSEKEVSKEKASDLTPKTVEGERIFIAVEKMPEFPGGGQSAMFKYLKEKTVYPQDTKQAKIEGMMVASFVVNKDGRISNVEILKKLHPSLDQAFEKVLQDMPTWTPGMQNGKEVAVKYTIPFRVEGEAMANGTNEPNYNQEEKVYIAVEQMPEFPGGQAAMFKYLGENFVIPAADKAKGKEGTIVASFVVTKEGKIIKLEIMRGVSPSLDKEAVRVLSSMPTWKPGMQNGKPVAVKYTIPYRIVIKREVDIPAVVPGQKNR